MRKETVYRFIVPVLLVLFGAATAPASHATCVVDVGLADMVDHAGAIFDGVCIERRVNPGARPTTTYTFRVLRGLKGADEDRFTFSMAGTPGREGYSGLPSFRVGERALVALYPVGPKGLTSPVGLDQGSFRIYPGVSGEPLAANGRHNRGLLRDVDVSFLKDESLDRTQSQGLSLVTLQRLIERLNRRGER